MNLYRQPGPTVRRLLLSWLFLLLLPTSGVASAQGEPSYESVEKLIRERGLKKIEDLLPLLPESYRRNHLLMFESGSLQDASHQSPRAILFGESANFIMSFNGHAGQKGFYALETISWNENQSSFEFREIAFPKDEAGQVQFSQKNPAKCLQCHRQDPRPNWHHYNAWPGAYGQADDLPYTEQFEFRDPLTAEHIVMDNRKAGQELKVFLQSIDGHPRYRHLTDAAFSHGELNNGPRSKGILNQVFTRKISAKNFKRIARLVRAHPRYDLLKYILMAGFYCAPKRQNLPLPEFLPAKLCESKPVGYDPDRTPGTHVHYGILKYIFGKLGEPSYPFSDWFMNFQPGPGNSFSSSVTDGGDQIIYFLALQDPEIRELIDIRIDRSFGEDGNYAYFGGQMTCEQLRNKVQSELQRYKEGESYSICKKDGGTENFPEGTRPQAMNSCIGCHSENPADFSTNAPTIHFDDDARLSRQLKQKNREGKTLYERILYRISDRAPLKRRMPLGRHPLSPEEELAVKNYLDRL